MKLFNKLAFIFLRFYQRFISPLLGSNCRFYPSCSEYAIQCFQQFSFFKAVLKTLIRLFKCHPYHPGGFDPVVKNSELDSNKSVLMESMHPKS